MKHFHTGYTLSPIIESVIDTYALTEQSNQLIKSYTVTQQLPLTNLKLLHLGILINFSRTFPNFAHVDLDAAFAYCTKSN